MDSSVPVINNLITVDTSNHVPESSQSQEVGYKGDQLENYAEECSKIDELTSDLVHRRKTIGKSVSKQDFMQIEPLQEDCEINEMIDHCERIEETERTPELTTKIQISLDTSTSTLSETKEINDQNHPLKCNNDGKSEPSGESDSSTIRGEIDDNESSDPPVLIHRFQSSKFRTPDYTFPSPELPLLTSPAKPGSASKEKLKKNPITMIHRVSRPFFKESKSPVVKQTSPQKRCQPRAIRDDHLRSKLALQELKERLNMERNKREQLEQRKQDVRERLKLLAEKQKQAREKSKKKSHQVQAKYADVVTQKKVPLIERRKQRVTSPTFESRSRSKIFNSDSLKRSVDSNKINTAVERDTSFANKELSRLTTDEFKFEQIDSEALLNEYLGKECLSTIERSNSEDSISTLSQSSGTVNHAWEQEEIDISSLRLDSKVQRYDHPCVDSSPKTPKPLTDTPVDGYGWDLGDFTLSDIDELDEVDREIDRNDELEMNCSEDHVDELMRTLKEERDQILEESEESRHAEKEWYRNVSSENTTQEKLEIEDIELHTSVPISSNPACIEYLTVNDSKGDDNVQYVEPETNQPLSTPPVIAQTTSRATPTTSPVDSDSQRTGVSELIVDPVLLASLKDMVLSGTSMKKWTKGGLGRSSRKFVWINPTSKQINWANNPKKLNKFKSSTITGIRKGSVDAKHRANSFSIETDKKSAKQIILFTCESEESVSKWVTAIQYMLDNQL